MIAHETGEYLAVTAKEPFTDGRSLDPAGDGHGARVNHGYGVLVFRQTPKGVERNPLKPYFGRDWTAPDLEADGRSIAFSPRASPQDLLAITIWFNRRTYVDSFYLARGAAVQIFDARTGRRVWTAFPTHRKFPRNGRPTPALVQTISHLKFSAKGRFLQIKTDGGTRRE